MRVRITGHTHPRNWYADKIGKVFEVRKHIPKPGRMNYIDHYEVVGSEIHVIAMSCCEIVKSELFQNLYNKLCS